MIKRTKLVQVGGLLGSACVAGAYVLKAAPKTPQAYQNVAEWSNAGEFRLLRSNGIPDHPTGAFPNRHNPNTIKPQSYTFRVPIKPLPNPDNITMRGVLPGVAINGVPFDPGTAELWNNNFMWHYEALSGLLLTQGGLGVDDSNAHVQPNGAYHYHGLPMGLLKRLNYTSHMTLIGYGADGYPMYGPYGYTNPNDASSKLKELTPGWRLKSGERPGGNGPGGVYDGSFMQDFEFVEGAGDLDKHNGRFGVTPEYPGGTYYYVITKGFPFVPRDLKGIPDRSFRKQMGPPPRGGRMPIDGPPGQFPPPGGMPPKKS